VRVAQSQSRALLERDRAGLLATMNAIDYRNFASQALVQADAQPAWLKFSLEPTLLVFENDHAFLTVAQWNEPIDASISTSSNGSRWVLELQKSGTEWLVTGRWPETPEIPMVH
jgi:hypothetical protein